MNALSDRGIHPTREASGRERDYTREGCDGQVMLAQPPQIMQALPVRELHRHAPGSEAARMALHAYLNDHRARRGNDDLLTLELHARAVSGKRHSAVEAALSLDWSPHYSSRFGTAISWPRLVCAAKDVAEAAAAMGFRRVLATGNPSAPAAVVLGSAFPSTGSVSMTWRPYRDDGDAWSLAADEAKPSARLPGWEVTELHDGLRQSESVAIAVSITSDVVASLRRTPAPVTGWASVTSVRPSRLPARLGRSSCAALVRMTVNAIRRAQGRRPNARAVHLFSAAPAAFNVLLATALPRDLDVMVYEFDASGASYRPAVVITAFAMG